MILFLFAILSIQVDLVFCLVKSDIFKFIIVPTIVVFSCFCLLLFIMFVCLIYFQCSRKLSKYSQRKEEKRMKEVISNHLTLKEFDSELHQ